MLTKQYANKSVCLHVAKPLLYAMPPRCSQTMQCTRATGREKRPKLQQKPVVTTHRGNKQFGPVLGILGLGLREHTIEIADPDMLLK